MAANNGGSTSTGRTIYYNVSYGALRANEKDAPEGYKEITLADIKSKRSKNENVDLRSSYYNSESGTYPFRVFYTDISGVITSLAKEETKNGISLQLTLNDEEGDTSVIQVDFYNKISADLLNRLLSVEPANMLNFRPYAIPAEATIGNETIKYYNSGVSIKDNGVKQERAFKGENSGLPPSERIKDTQGKEQTSRVAQIDFLWERVSKKFNSQETASNTQPAAKTEAPKANTAAASSMPPPEDLPF